MIELGGQNHDHRLGEDRQTDGQTDGQGESNIPPSQTSFAEGIKNYKIKCYCDHCDHYLRKVSPNVVRPITLIVLNIPKYNV